MKTIGAKKISMLGVTLALALIIGLVENAFPPFLAALPYAKLGLANAVTLFLLSVYGEKEAGSVLLLRCLLAAVFSGNPSMLIYSLSGGILAMAIMALLLRTGRFGIAAVSAAGGGMHNLGQLIAGTLVTGTNALMVYTPYMMSFGMLAGLLTGAMTYAVIKKFPEKLLI